MPSSHDLLLCDLVVPRGCYIKFIDALNVKQRQDRLGAWSPVIMYDIDGDFHLRIQVEKKEDFEKYMAEAELFKLTL